MDEKSTIKCEGCGAEILQSANFCGSCGKKIIELVVDETLLGAQSEHNSHESFSAVEADADQVKNTTDIQNIQQEEGTVLLYKKEKGWGFILSKQVVPEEKVFVHFSDIKDWPSYLVAGEQVCFSCTKGEKGLVAKNVSRVVPRIRGIVHAFDKGSGSITTNDSEQIYVESNDILESKLKTLEIGKTVEFSMSDDSRRGKKAIRVIKVSALNAFAELGDFNKHLENLVGLAKKEKWKYTHSPSDEKYPVLYSYLLNTFERVQTEGKIAYAQTSKGEKRACFNSGLATDLQEEIFALFFENQKRHPNEPDWRLWGFFNESHDLLTVFGNPPEIANYFDDPSQLIYNTKKRFVTKRKHIFKENRYRFPEQYRLLTDDELVMRVEGAIKAAVRRVERNYKTAIPHFYKGQLQLLLPLCLGSSDQANLALAVHLEDETYVASTVLTLEQAYNNARLIARPDDEWLNP